MPTTTKIPCHNEEEDVSERNLLDALRENEQWAYELLLSRFGGRIWATARRFLPCESDCADAVQRAFLSAFRSISKFEANSSLGTWLHRIVVNECLMLLRKKSRTPEVSVEELLPQFDSSGHHAGPIAVWRQLPEDELLRKETQFLVRSCIEQLPEEYRTVLMLRDIEELSTEETARQLGASEGAIKTRLHRARQALRTLLEPHLAE